MLKKIKLVIGKSWLYCLIYRNTLVYYVKKKVWLSVHIIQKMRDQRRIGEGPTGSDKKEVDGT